MQQNFDQNQELENKDLQPEMGDNYAANFQQSKQSFDPYEKKSSHGRFWLLFFFALAIVIMSGTHIYRNFYEPLKYETPEWLAEQMSEEEQNAKTIAELKENDTDGDGLTDYNELYQYYTSMFIEDTDSDGFTDKEEIDLGQDPLCPIGDSCNLLRLITPNTKLSDVIQDITFNSDVTVQQAAVEEFRKFLLENGMTQEELSLLTDEDLLNIFRIVDESNILAEEQLNASTTPEEIKAFLLAQPGADVEEINLLSDEELLQIAEDLYNA